MSYVKSETTYQNLSVGHVEKRGFTVKDLLMCGLLSSALLGVVSTLAFTAAFQNGMPIAQSIIFPVGLILAVWPGFEFVTGNFASRFVTAGRTDTSN